MRDVLIVVFWLWLLISLAVYGYRIFRRVTQGPKAERQARGAAAPDDVPEPASSPLKGLGRTAPPPLPEGPLEPRLPRSLEGVVPEGEPENPVARDDAEVAGAAVPAAEPPPPTQRPTLAEALSGIQMPDGLLPVVDPALPGIADGRVAHFSATGTTVAEVAVGLATELRRLGYAVDGLDTMTPDRAGLSARRDDAVVSASIDVDDANGAIRVQLHT